MCVSVFGTPHQLVFFAGILLLFFDLLFIMYVASFLGFFLFRFASLPSFRTFHVCVFVYEISIAQFGFSLTRRCQR